MEVPVSGRRELRWGLVKGPTAQLVWGLWAWHCLWQVWQQLGIWDVGLDLSKEVGPSG